MPEILELNTKVDEEHALEIERQIRVIKERAWKIWSSISFKEILGKIVIFIVENSWSYNYSFITLIFYRLLTV